MISEIAEYLEDQDLGTVGTNIFYSKMPDGITSGIAIFDTGGEEPDIDLPTKQPTFQVFIRATSYAAGKTVLDQVRTALHNKYNIELIDNATYFYYIQALAEGGHLGENEAGVNEFSINFRTKIR